MKARHKKKDKSIRENSEKMILRLFELADFFFKEKPDLSNRYVELARKISMKYKVKIPRHLKRRYCKSCFFYLYPGVNSRVRLTQRKIVYYCFNCKKHMRFPLKPKKVRK